MRKATSLLVVTLGLLAAVPKPLQPRIEKYDGSLQLDIGKSVQDALKKFDPYFRTWTESDFLPAVRTTYNPTAKQTLTGVIGDFNGDRIQDVALSGHNRTHNRLLVALSDSQSNLYKIVEVDRSPLTDPRKQWIEGPKGNGNGLWRYLSHAKPGRVSSPFERAPLHLRTEAFEETYFQKASVLYYWHEGRFEKYTTHD